jgi:hypothetical protein
MCGDEPAAGASVAAAVLPLPQAAASKGARPPGAAALQPEAPPAPSRLGPAPSARRSASSPCCACWPCPGPVGAAPGAAAAWLHALPPARTAAPAAPGPRLWTWTVLPHRTAAWLLSVIAQASQLTAPASLRLLALRRQLHWLRFHGRPHEGGRPVWAQGAALQSVVRAGGRAGHAVTPCGPSLEGFRTQHGHRAALVGSRAARIARARHLWASPARAAYMYSAYICLCI